jgi:hypothetical protein
MNMKKITIATIMTILLLVGMLNIAVVGATSTVESVEWLPPLTKHEEYAFTDGSTLPIKFRLLDEAESFVIDQTVEATVNEILYSDGFDDGNYDGWDPVDSGISWSVTATGELYNDGTLHFPRIFADSTIPFTDYIFEADAQLLDGAGGYALLFRVEHENWKFYSFQYDKGSGGLKLYRFDGLPPEYPYWPPEGYEVDSETFPVEYDEWHHLKVQVVGANIKCYIDGIKVFDVTDTAAPLTGGIGLRTWHATAEFDNVVVLEVPEWESFSYADGTIDVSESIYRCNLHTKELGMPAGDYMVTVWLEDRSVQVGSHPFELVEPGKGKGKP